MCVCVLHEDSKKIENGNKNYLVKIDTSYTG